jgi:hypothetical protein
MCLDSTFVKNMNVHDVFQYDARRVLENVFLLIAIIMFFVVSYVRLCISRLFVSESNVRFCVKRHVNVITCCDKFEHDSSSSNMTHQVRT